MMSYSCSGYILIYLWWVTLLAVTFLYTYDWVIIVAVPVRWSPSRLKWTTPPLNLMLFSSSSAELSSTRNTSSYTKEIRRLVTFGHVQVLQGLAWLTISYNISINSKRKAGRKYKICVSLAILKRYRPIYYNLALNSKIKSILRFVISTDAYPQRLT